jgi:hypothetical protein
MAEWKLVEVKVGKGYAYRMRKGELMVSKIQDAIG